MTGRQSCNGYKAVSDVDEPSVGLVQELSETPQIMETAVSALLRVLLGGCETTRPAMRFALFTATELAELDAWTGPLLPYEPLDHQHLIDHGTDRGYQQHRRYRIAVCPECREAHTESRRRDRAA